MDGISESVGINSQFITANGNVLVEFGGNTAEAGAGCYSITSPRTLLNLGRRGKCHFLRCFVRQTYHNEKFSESVTKGDAHVGHEVGK